MAGWTMVYADDLEDGFYDQDSDGEVTIPVRHQVIWDDGRARPEMDAKDAKKGHPEVYNGRYSATGFHRFNTFRWWCYSDPVDVVAGRRTRASIAAMLLSHGIEGNSAKKGACGMRVGLGPVDALPDSQDIAWSEWIAVRKDTQTAERTWYELQTPEMIPSVGRVKLIVQCNADLPADISAGFWDAERIEQYVDGVEPPPPGDHTVEVYLDGQLVSSSTFGIEVRDVVIRPAGGLLTRMRLALRALIDK